MWWSVLPQLIGAVLLLLAPGFLVAWGLRYRGFDALALSPALSIGVIVIASTVSPFLHVRFNLLPVAVVAVVLGGIAWFVSRSRPRAGTVPGSGLWRSAAPFVAGLLAFVVIGARVMQAIGAPEHFSQTYDAVFHLNSVKYALDTGNASSLTIGDMTGGGFYPAGWNAVATLVASTFGLDVPTAVNLTSIILGAVFWPLGCLLAARWTIGRSAEVALAVGVACASLGAFPLLMMDFGVLYPNLLSISLLPSSIALAAAILRVSPDWVPRDLPAVLALLLSLAGLVVAHPTTFMAWLTWTAPMVGFLSWKTIKLRKRNLLRIWHPRFTVPLISYCVAFVILWAFLRPPPDASFWGPYHTAPQALGEAIVFSPLDLPAAWLVAPLALLGLWAAARQLRYRWLAAVFLIFTGLFVVVSGFPISRIRSILTGVWYNDSYRIAALLPLVAVLLAAVGVEWICHNPYIRQWFKRVLLRSDSRTLPSGLRTALQHGAALVLVALAVLLGQVGGVNKEVALASSKYALTPNSPLVSSDELHLIQRLPADIPQNAILLGNPYTGASLSYALGDRRSAQLHILSYVSPDLQEIYDRLGNVTGDPDVCRAVRGEHSYYVMDFGLTEVHGGNHTPAGLLHLDQNPGVKLVDSQGPAKLYKITACGDN
ncbi:hypothetical protein GCM10023063_09830 [Arthrobacter methylotrophus]|uniref:DUF6541 family protein n=1 Tax=Arthrobacter methylotrophus TaxID=121291 RepID=A0ABV5US98_9MICC